jgi:dipeptidase E
MLPKNKKTAYIPNAMDYLPDIKKRAEIEKPNIDQLIKLGLDVEVVDLRQYFGKQKELSKKLSEFGVIWVRGGSVFVLRQAMKFSGFDKIFKKLLTKEDMLYGGYSAGICILSPTLHGIEFMDDCTQRPYGKNSRIIWKGLDILDYYIVPHYKSGIEEQAKLADKAIKYFIKKKLHFKTLRDGDVIIIKNLPLSKNKHKKE